MSVWGIFISVIICFTLYGMFEMIRNYIRRYMREHFSNIKTCNHPYECSCITPLKM